MQLRKLLTPGMAALAVFLIRPPDATAVTLTFADTFNSVGIYGDSSGLWDGLVPGTSGSLTVNFNSTGTDLTPDPKFYISNESIDSAVLMIRSHTLTFGSGSVAVVNDYGGFDQFILNLNPSDQTPSATSDFSGLQFLFTDFTAIAFASTALQPALAAMIGGSGQFDLVSQSNEAHGIFSVSQSTSPVPDTGASGLLFGGAIIGLVGLQALTRRHTFRSAVIH